MERQTDRPDESEPDDEDLIDLDGPPFRVWSGAHDRWVDAEDIERWSS